jgi:serine/threonine protein kinase
MSINEIIEKALELNPQDRYMVIENLILSLDQADSMIDRLWMEESTKRLQAIKDGNLKTISYDELFAS